MKRNYRLKNLGCANCAAKMERDIQKLPGVTEATISFMTTKLTLEAEDDRYEDIVRQAQEIAQKYEPEVVLQRA